MIKEKKEKEKKKKDIFVIMYWLVVPVDSDPVSFFFVFFFLRRSILMTVSDRLSSGVGEAGRPLEVVSEPQKLGVEWGVVRPDLTTPFLVKKADSKNVLRSLFLRTPPALCCIWESYLFLVLSFRPQRPVRRQKIVVCSCRSNSLMWSYCVGSCFVKFVTDTRIYALLHSLLVSNVCPLSILMPEMIAADARTELWVFNFPTRAAMQWDHWTSKCRGDHKGGVWKSKPVWKRERGGVKNKFSWGGKKRRRRESGGSGGIPDQGR